MASVVSCLAHVAALALISAYPELLTPGLNRWLRIPITIGPQSELRNSRIVTFVGRGVMPMPSAETLRKNTYDWNAAGSGKNPPIVVQWDKKSGDQAEAKRAATRPVPGREEPKPAPVSPGDPGSGGQAADAGAGDAAQAGYGGAAAGGGSGIVPLPSPSETRPAQPPPKVVDANVAPKTIPDSIPPPPPAPAPPKPAPAQQAPAPVKVFEDEQKAIRSEGTGLFDTKGFPLGDYANMIIERIKGNWYIPSNLRNSQGRTTVIFFIGKDGRYTNAHIVTSSGSTSLDLSALNAVLVSNPFPPLPRGFPGEQVGAKFVFSYNERQ